MDETKLKEARSGLIDRVVALAKVTDTDTVEIDELLKLIERIDHLLSSRRSTP